MTPYSSCRLCPRNCGVDRRSARGGGRRDRWLGCQRGGQPGMSRGFCGASVTAGPPVSATPVPTRTIEDAEYYAVIGRRIILASGF